VPPGAVPAGPDAVRNGRAAAQVTGCGVTFRLPTAPPAYLKVAHKGGTVCGTLQSADGGVLRLSVAGAHTPAVIPLTSVTNLAVVASCP
jgi:hypothetical protein